MYWIAQGQHRFENHAEIMINGDVNNLCPLLTKQADIAVGNRNI